jgi:hypothetical protein
MKLSGRACKCGEAKWEGSEVEMRGSEVSTNVVKWSEVWLGEVQWSVTVTGCLTLLEDIQVIWSLLLMWLFLLSHSFMFFWFHFYQFIRGCIFCIILFNFVNCVFLLLRLCILFVMYVMFCIFYFHCVVLYVTVCTVLLPPGVNTVAFNKYIKYQYQYIPHIIV